MLAMLRAIEAVGSLPAMTTLHDTSDSGGTDRLTARHLYWMGWRVARIAEHLDLKSATVHSWKQRDKWDDATEHERMLGSLEARYISLIVREKKSNADYKEIDELGRAFERLARIGKYNDSGKESDLNPRIRNRNTAPRKAKNDIGDEGLIQLFDAFEGSLFDYQRHWYAKWQHERIRNILKSRQIGATWYYAREAVVDAFETGKNKIFLSASKNQALIFRNYIVQFVKQATGVELKGEPLVLANGAELHFLGTNAKTAQGYHGDVYLDEYFWIHGFQTFRKVTSGMAMHKQWKQTYFSTPSSIDHEAYGFWSGEQYNARRKRDQKVAFDISHSTLAKGLRGPDGHWRQIVTVKDAIAGGCDLFDLDQLRLEYSEDEFDNLLMCQFMDDAQSAFPLSVMKGCAVDAFDRWMRDYKPWTKRPFGEKRVWIGYDPSGESEDGDGAGLAVIAPAASMDDAHRVLEYHRLRGADYEAQAEFIERVTKRYTVEHIGIDVTGMGDSVAQLVEKFFSRVTRYRYTPDLKSAMVRQTQHIIRKQRLQFDAGAHDITQAFTAIKRTLTKSSTQITYKAGRNQHTGHSDIAWAIMHALHFEPLDGPQTASRSIIEAY